MNWTESINVTDAIQNNFMEGDFGVSGGKNSSSINLSFIHSFIFFFFILMSAYLVSRIMEHSGVKKWMEHSLMGMSLAISVP